jgi:hypothetical protein
MIRNFKEERRAENINSKYKNSQGKLKDRNENEGTNKNGSRLNRAFSKKIEKKM